MKKQLIILVVVAALLAVTVPALATPSVDSPSAAVERQHPAENPESAPLERVDGWLMAQPRHTTI